MESPKITKCIYVEVEDKKNDKLSVWHYFLRSEDKKLGKCKIETCQAILKAAGGSTSGLGTHLRTKHNIDLKKLKKETKDKNPTEEPVSDHGGVLQQKKIDGYFGKHRKELSEVVVELVAKDGLTFRVFEKSEQLRESLKARGYNIPKSAKTFKKMVINYSKDVRQKQKAVIKDLVAKGERFCITFDEWTSLRNRRYISLILHGKNSEIWNLGLIRIHRSLTSEKCLALVEKRLQEYDLSMKNHILCIFTDGPAYQQLCYAHGIQLAVIDVLYKTEETNEKSKKFDIADDEENEEDGVGAVSDEDGDTDDEGEQDDENEKPEDEVFYDENDGECDDFEGFGIDEDTTDISSVELSEYVKPLVEKVRKIVKMFRRSPKKNEVLQDHVKADFKKNTNNKEKEKELNLVLDTKTRWSSLAIMLKRFLVIHSCIKKALVEVKSTMIFEEGEDYLLSEIADSLEPIQAAVEALCRRDSNLITADATVIFTLKTLKEQNTRLSSELFHAICRRMKQRRTNLSSVLQYLHTNTNSAMDESDLNASWSSEVSELFDAPSKTKIETLIKEILIRLCVNTDGKLMYPHEEEAEVDAASKKEKQKKKKKKKSEVHKDLDNAKGYVNQLRRQG